MMAVGLKLDLVRFWSSGLVEMSMFSWDFEVVSWLRFWRWNLSKLCVRTHDMTSRSYFGKMNSTLGSVVPLAMFFIYRDMWMLSECFRSLQTSADLYYLNSVKRVNIKFQRMLCTFAFDSKYKRRQRSQHSTENRTCYMLCILFYWKVLEKAPVWRQILSCGWVSALCMWIWKMSL